MKSKFSTSWKSSIQPRKQHKFRHNAPLHTRHKFLSSHLSKLLRQKYGKRNLPLREGDEVLVMRGRFKKKQAKVISVNLKRSFVNIEGLQVSKRDGTKVSVPFNPRALQIISLNESDRQRLVALNRKSVEAKSNKKEK
ncbi:MAG: 50S ribosomal protein L24 [Nanoarchaeota archaeon]